MKTLTYKSGCYSLKIVKSEPETLTLYRGGEPVKNTCRGKKRTLYAEGQKLLTDYMKSGGFNDWLAISELVDRTLKLKKEKKHTSEHEQAYMRSGYVRHLNNLLRQIWDDPETNTWNG